MTIENFPSHLFTQAFVKCVKGWGGIVEEKTATVENGYCRFNVIVCDKNKKDNVEEFIEGLISFASPTPTL